jgi:hypothetical protein
MGPSRLRDTIPISPLILLVVILGVLDVGLAQFAPGGVPSMLLAQADGAADSTALDGGCPTGAQYDYSCTVGSQSTHPGETCEKNHVVENSEVQGKCIGPRQAEAFAYKNADGEWQSLLEQNPTAVPSAPDTQNQSPSDGSVTFPAGLDAQGYVGETPGSQLQTGPGPDGSVTFPAGLDAQGYVGETPGSQLQTGPGPDGSVTFPAGLDAQGYVGETPGSQNSPTYTTQPVNSEQLSEFQNQQYNQMNQGATFSQTPSENSIPSASTLNTILNEVNSFAQSVLNLFHVP